MSATLVIRDVTGAGTDSGTASPAMTLDFLDEEITVRELIERRVYEEVHDHNHARTSPLQRLVSPAAAEAALSPPRVRERRPLDWTVQRDRAIEGFQRNAFFVLVNDRQVTSLEDRIQLSLATEVTFVRLVPLVGG
jgi:hypothetical protein